MNIRIFTLIGVLTYLCLSVGPAWADDERIPVNLPPEVKDAFLKEMRGHMGNLDDILTAIAEENFKEAADIADVRMDFGHKTWEAMAQQGMSADQITAMKARMKKTGMKRGPGTGGGRGMGQFMPEDFRVMGQQFHLAAANFAIKARAVGLEPTATDYRNVIGALEEVTLTCRGCHEAFRVE